MTKYFIAGLAAWLISGCSQMPLNGGSNSSSIPLVWKPTTNLVPSGTIDLTGRKTARLRIEVTDNRADAGLIGRNSEKLPPRRVTTPDNVAAFVGEHMKQIIAGTSVAEIDDASRVILKVEIQQFLVEETEIYNGDVRLKVTLVNGNDSPLWTGITGGTSIRFGRSFSAENYYETLSDSLIDAVHHLIQSTTFRAALAGTT